MRRQRIHFEPGYRDRVIGTCKGKRYKICRREGDGAFFLIREFRHVCEATPWGVDLFEILCFCDLEAYAEGVALRLIRRILGRKSFPAWQRRLSLYQ